MINLPLYASTPPMRREAGSGAWEGGTEGQGHTTTGDGRGPQKEVPIIIKPGAPEGDDEDTEAAGHTRLGWKETEGNRTGRAVAVDNDRRGERVPPDPFRLAGFR